MPSKRRKGNRKSIQLFGASGNNLKDVNCEFPLGKLICVTGVSGSEIISNSWYAINNNQKELNEYKVPLPYIEIKGLENINKIIEVDQSPIGRTPRSNPATYTGVFTEIRNLFSSLSESKIRV